MRNSTILLTALVVERLAFYRIIPIERVVIPGLLYIRLGIRTAPSFPHIGTSFFAGGALMVAFFITPMFPVIGLILVAVALSLLGLRLLRRTDGVLLAIARMLSVLIFRAYPFILRLVYVNREELDIPRKPKLS